MMTLTSSLLLLASLLAADFDSPARHAPDAAGVLEQLRRSQEEERLEDLAIRRLQEMGLRARVDLYLGSPRLRGGRGMEPQAQRIDALLRDPALHALEQLEAEWFRGLGGDLFLSARELVQLQVMVARNLDTYDETPTPEAVRRHVRLIRQLRARYASTPLFQDRSVVFAAGHEKVKGREVFGRAPVQRAVRNQAADFSFLQPDSPESDRSLRRDPEGQLAASMSETTSPVTLFFQGHGRERSWKFGGRLSERTVARLLPEREDRSDIVIASTCWGHDFVRAVLSQLQRTRPDSRLPIVVVPQEFGQKLVVDPWNDTFARFELGLGLRTGQLGELVTEAHPATSVYVPDHQNRPLQIL